MFFIMGISQGRKKLDFDQTILCGHCGRYGHLEVYVIYSYLSLFFIPIFKWGKRYYVRAACCDTTVEIEKDLGRQIERGEVTSLPSDIIPQTYRYGAPRQLRCPSCGYETVDDFQFCPKCGQRL
ncbi:MAG: zinc ribbon domain-containing protein [Clostridiales bacterium]|nr:zinc ribbon domain-containing protein [Clostridiales bacterium]